MANVILTVTHYDKLRKDTYVHSFWMENEIVAKELKKVLVDSIPRYGEVLDYIDKECFYLYDTAYAETKIVIFNYPKSISSGAIENLIKPELQKYIEEDHPEFSEIVDFVNEIAYERV